MLDTGSPASAISPAARDELVFKRLVLPAAVSSGYLLTNSTVNGQPLPDFMVRVLPRLTRLGVDGLLGLDFLRRFRRVGFLVDDLLLTLEGR